MFIDRLPRPILHHALPLITGAALFGGCADETGTGTFGCERDSDCKGTRICVDATCEDPYSATSAGSSVSSGATSGGGCTAQYGEPCTAVSDCCSGPSTPNGTTCAYLGELAGNVCVALCGGPEQCTAGCCANLSNGQKFCAGGPICDGCGTPTQTYCPMYGTCLINDGTCPFWCHEGTSVGCSSAPEGLVGCTGPIHHDCQ